MLSCRQTLAGQLGVCLCCFCLVESSGWALIRVLVDRGMMLPLQQLLLSSAFATNAMQIYQQGSHLASVRSRCCCRGGISFLSYCLTLLSFLIPPARRSCSWWRIRSFSSNIDTFHVQIEASRAPVDTTILDLPLQFGAHPEHRAPLSVFSAT